MKILVLDFGIGNVGSIRSMYRKIGYQVIVSGQADAISEASHFILPGVGAFDTGIKRMKESDGFNELCRQVLEFKKPLLGICLGMQLLTQRSEEGVEKGLGWIDGETKRFDFSKINFASKALKIPHMRWNEIEASESDPLLGGYEQTPRFYFVHSYHVCCNNSQESIATTVHGIKFTSCIRRDNVMGVQFHPEKSHRYGLKVLENFARL
ncbi:imidazole glycerol phosphate synthase subunit HisH [Verrucomicrobia bacterium]|nr:imidazole glycerol phosphate synthase subunit HisH [Verrucomicrobiota bacterium]